MNWLIVLGYCTLSNRYYYFSTFYLFSYHIIIITCLMTLYYVTHTSSLSKIKYHDIHRELYM